MHQIIRVDEKNLTDYPQVICFINPNNKYFRLKIDWLKNRFSEGLNMKVIKPDQAGKVAGYIEYVPGEFAWRAVNALDYMFIHCLWVYPNNNKKKGLGSALLEEAESDARNAKMKGVAVVSSDGAFMANRDLFLKNGYTVKEEMEKCQLLVKNFKGEQPALGFNNTADARSNLKGWHMVYSSQCPWVARFVEEAKPLIKKHQLDMNIRELTTAREAQQAPSVYAVFNLIRDGKLLADRYISTTRFENILKKELK
ncbi:MAG: GNAT family N-acetyltransferase [Bacteroidales bacterium]|nr:GNAT family N-acetyltransferase [Bacteroidales bacterium]